MPRRQRAPADEFELAVKADEPEIIRPGIIYFRHDRASRRIFRAG
jgi:hypothetical protein